MNANALENYLKRSSGSTTGIRLESSEHIEERMNSFCRPPLSSFDFCILPNSSTGPETVCELKEQNLCTYIRTSFRLGIACEAWVIVCFITLVKLSLHFNFCSLRNLRIFFHKIQLEQAKMEVPNALEKLLVVGEKEDFTFWHLYFFATAFI